MFEGLIISHDPYFSTLLQERIAKLVPQPATLQIELDESKIAPTGPLPFHLVIIDLDMPKLDMMQLLVDFQQSSHAIFIVFSNTPNVYRRQQALQKGADQFFVKPQSAAEWTEIEQDIATLLIPKADLIPSEVHVSSNPSQLPPPPSIQINTPPPTPLTPQPALKIQTSLVLSNSASQKEAVVSDFSDPVPENDSERATTRLIIPTRIVGQVTAEGMVPLVSEEDQISALPPVESKWKVGLTGDLLDSYQVVDPERSAFLTHFIYVRLADISVALESDYFNHLTLLGPTHHQVLVPDQYGIHHAVLNAQETGEPQREQFIIWCCERSL